MAESSAIFASVTGIQPALDPAGPAETLRRHPDGVRIEFEGGQVALLHPGSIAAGTLGIIDQLRARRSPVYVDLDPATRKITRLLIPLVSRVRRLQEDSESGIVVELESSHAIHRLPKNHPQYVTLLERLRHAMEHSDWVALAESDRHEVVAIRQWRGPAAERQLGAVAGSFLLDRFIPDPDIRERHTVEVAAPAALTLETARHFDLQSVWLVRLLFQLRARLLGAAASPSGPSVLDIDSLRAMGWAVLDEVAGAHFIAGTACRPWKAEVGFTPVAAADFPTYAEPDRVRIAWTLEVEPLGPEHCRLSTETRAAATDATARVKFRRYWRFFGVGIVLIRRLLLPAVRRQAERDWRRASGSPLERPDQS